MFKLNNSSTVNLSIEEVISRLEKHEDVESVLLAGSGGNKALLPHSDYDLILVLKKMPVPLFSVFTYIDHRITDVFFFTTEEIDNILSKEKLDADDMEGKLITWLQDGKITVDKSDKLEKLKAKVSSLEVTDLKKYAAWFGINYNYAQNMRYFNSKDEDYLKALDIRLLYCVAETLTGYFSLRNMPWRGEKAAIKYFRENDPKFLEVFEQYSVADSRDKKVELYTELVKLILSPVGEIWGNNIEGITIKKDFSKKSVEQGLAFWDSLFK